MVNELTREMKDSGVEWIGEIPESWKVSKLKHVLYEKKEKNDSDEPIILSLARSGIKVRDISTNEGQLAESYLNYNKVDSGDLLLNPMDLISGANCNVSGVKGVISTAYFNLNPRGKNNIYYYEYYFKLQYWEKILFAHGTGVSYENRWTLNRETLLNYTLPLPPVEKQKSIANFLDNKTKEINNIISETKEVIKEYKNYKQSLITETVTKGLDKNVQVKDSGIEWIGETPKYWKIIKLKYLVAANEKTLGSKIDSEYEFRYVNIGSVDLHKGITEYENIKYKDSPSRARRIVKKGDLIISTVRTYLKAITTIEDDNNVIVSTGFAVLTPKRIKEKYLEYITKTNFFVGEVIRNSVGVSYPAINTSDLLEIKILYPPLKEQEKIVIFLDKKVSKIDHIIETKEKLVEEMQAYKKSLIYETVTGKREVN